MPVEIILPKVDMDMSHARLLQWHVAPGEPVSRGDVLFEIETDKSTMEIEATADGTLGFVSGEAGSDIEIGCTIGWIFQAGEDASVDPAQASSTPFVEAAPASSVGPSGPLSGGHGPEAPPDTAASKTVNAPSGTVRATPLARATARKRDVSLHGIDGSGPQGRILAADIERGDSSAGRSAHELSYRGAIASRQWGDPANPAHPTEPSWVLLHGFAGDSTTWSALAARLAGKGRHVIAPDLPGHGSSRSEARVPEQLSEVLGALSGALPQGRGCHVVAHSMGALPALQLAASAQMDVRSLTLLAPVGMGSHIDRNFLLGMARPSSRAAMQHQLRKLGERGLSMSEAALDTLYRSLAQGRLCDLANALASETGQSVDIVAPLAELAARMPCRVVVGHQDRILDWRDACRLGAHVAVHHLPLAGHVPHWDAPVEVGELLLSIG